MLNGTWGCGKTYCFEDDGFKEAIEKHIYTYDHNFSMLKNRVNSILEFNNDEEALGEYKEIVNDMEQMEYDVNIYPYIMEDILNVAKILMPEKYDDEKPRLKKIVETHALNNVKEFIYLYWLSANENSTGIDDIFWSRIVERVKGKIMQESKNTLKEIFLYKYDITTEIKKWISLHEGIRKENGLFYCIDVSLFKKRLEKMAVAEIFVLSHIIHDVYDHKRDYLRLYNCLDGENLQESIRIVEELIKVENGKIRRYNYNKLLEVMKKSNKNLQKALEET